MNGFINGTPLLIKVSITIFEPSLLFMLASGHVLRLKTSFTTPLLAKILYLLRAPGGYVYVSQFMFLVTKLLNENVKIITLTNVN